MAQTKHITNKKRQPGYLLVFLCFLPLFALNLGYSFLTGIDFYWKTQEQQEVANQEVEALAAGSEFSFQFARLAGEFSKMFQAAAVDLKDDSLSSFVRKNSEKVFRWPFPNYELFTFHVPEDKSNGEMLFMHSDLRPSRRLFVRAFEHLVSVNKGERLSGALGRQNEALLKRIMQSDVQSDVTARTQRGKASFAFYRYYPHWFLWDYFEVPGKGLFGFFLFSRNDDERKFAAKLLALRDLREHSTAKGAFLPLYSGYGGAVLQSPLQRSNIFKNWARERISPVEADLRKWLENGIPPATDLGKYTAHSYLGKGHTHLTTLLMPSIVPPSRPVWLFLTNLFLLSLLMLLLVRGLLLGQWPDIGIRLRFIATYMLVATLPVSLLLLTAYGYVTQYRRAIHFQSVSELHSCIRQFDTRKAQVNDEYRTAFAEVVEDKLLCNLLAEKGSESTEARDRILSFFEGRSEPLPLLSFAIFDENGKGARYYGAHAQATADPAIEAFRYPIVEVLRKKIKRRQPNVEFLPQKKSSIQETSLEAYKSMTKNDLVEEVDKRRLFPIARQFGSRTAIQIHELIKIDGCERFALYLVWDDQALDKKTFRQSVNHFGVNNSEFIFLAFRDNPQGLEFFGPPGRDASPEIIARARLLAEQASFRGSYAGKRYDNLSVVAIPSQKYANTILVGATRHYGLENAVTNRLAFLVAVLLIAIAIVLFCAFLSARMILDPITELKSALDNVSVGRLSVEITSSSRDEIGILCREFSVMTQGLREREKLATLLSDQAVEAIASAGRRGGVLTGDTFSGIALVSDIRNFTGHCEEHSPDVITGLLDEHFAQMARIISEHGGRIYKFIGDAIEAVFPEDASRAESAAERAFDAASLMLSRLKTINSERTRRRLFTYRVGVGLAAGQMHSGSIGSLDTRLDYAILGEPLKNAATLEALSVANPDFPLIIDEAVMNSLHKKSRRFSRLENSGDLIAFYLSEPATTIAQDPLQRERAAGTQQELTGSDKNRIQTIKTGGGSGLSSLSAFLLGTLLIATVFAGMIFGRQTSREARQNIEKISAAAENLRLIDQIKCDSAAKIGFEANCFRLVSDLEEILQHGAELSEMAVDRDFRAKVDMLTMEEGRPTKFAVFLYDKQTVNSENAVVNATLSAKGWSEVHLKALRNEAEYRRRLDFKPWNYHVPNAAEPILQEIFGNQITSVVLHREFFGKASEVMFDDTSEYFYWDYLTANNPDADSLHESGDVKRNRRPVVGLIMLAVNAGKIRHSLPLLVNSYQQSDKAIALVAGSGSIQLSSNFPPELSAILKVGSELPKSARYFINEDSITIDGKNHRLLVCHFAAEPVLLSGFSVTVSLFVACVLLWFWFRTIQGRTIASSSLAARLWMLLLISAVIPMITVFFVFDLFLNEDHSVKISQARADLQRATNLFELRESFVDPLAWKFAREHTWSKDLLQVTKALEEDAGQQNMDRLAAIMNSWYYEHDHVDPLIINYYPRDIAIAGKGGWEYATSGKDQKEVDPFGVMLKHIARSIVKRRSQEGQTGQVDGSAIEGEMIVEAGLQTVRSLFGDDVFVKLAHGVGLPVLMDVVAGTAGLIIHAVPGIENPEFIMVWLIHFDYESYLARIASNYRGDYLFWPVEAHRYGGVTRKDLPKNRHELVKMASWIASANLPVSGRIKHEGRWYLADGRSGLTQMTSLILAMAPEAPIDHALAQARFVFALLLVVTLLLILFIAKNVADDILMPIRSLISGMKQVGRENYSYRISVEGTDELGVLCSSFDQMMKGLEEKKLMGRMLSKSAQKFSLQDADANAQKMEFAFLYIGIPSFASWMHGFSKEALFSDLSGQVAHISRIVMEAGGDIDKIIGEKILAVFHADNDPAKAVAAACKAALQIVSVETHGQLTFPVAIGINFGTVITGFLGVGEKRDFTVIGDAVNVTARIEGFAETLRYQRCLASERIAELLPPDILAREHGEVELKGKSRLVKVYQLSFANGYSKGS
ncbi:MAG: HAMP domain-containing protein [Candidatus Riflebacteria bacterium]|nr:HAMP domain-containing protein [Candidatus Riflebacteria bacterium]